MFSNLSPWTWVIAAWIELVIVYGGYLLYLNWRARRASRGED